MRRLSLVTPNNRVTALLARFSSPASGPIEKCRLLTPAPPGLKNTVSTWVAPSGLSVTSREPSVLSPSRITSSALFPAYPVWWNVTVAAMRESAIAREATRTSLSSRSCASCSLLKPTAWTGMRRLRKAWMVSRARSPEPSREFSRRGGASHPAVKAVKPDLKLLLQSCQHAILESLLRRSLTGLFAVAAAIGNGHAARIIEYNRDYVLLWRQLGHRDRRLPQQDQHGSDQQRL